MIIYKLIHIYDNLKYEAIDHLAMANNVHWYGYALRREDGHVLRREDGHVLRREDGHVLRRALDLKVEGQRKNGRLKRTCKKQVEEESVKVGLRREDALGRSKWSVGANQIADGLR